MIVSRVSVQRPVFAIMISAAILASAGSRTVSSVST